LTLHSLARDEVVFGFGIDAEANVHLQRAASLVTSRPDSLQALLDAQQASPQQLEVLTALYKFYFYQGDIDNAEATVLRSLQTAATQAGFVNDWQALSPDAADWSDPRGAARAYLYALKALAFIRLRQLRADEAQQILLSLQRLDPDDQVGADVIRDLLEGLQDDSDE
jgi:hypothetical protein